MPKFAKVDGHTIKITVENANNVPVYKIVSDREMLIQQKKQIEKTIKNCDEILAEAKKLGISFEAPKPKVPSKGTLRKSG